MQKESDCRNAVLLPEISDDQSHCMFFMTLAVLHASEKIAADQRCGCGLTLQIKREGAGEDAKVYSFYKSFRFALVTIIYNGQALMLGMFKYRMRPVSDFIENLDGFGGSSRPVNLDDRCFCKMLES